MSQFTYGDSCQTGDDKYVIAQFRSDASLAWVSELRAFLMKDELKYKWFHPERHRVLARSELWKRVQAGVLQGEITIIDPRTYIAAVWAQLEELRAEPGIDFNLLTVNELSGRDIIEQSPLGAVRGFEMDWLNDNTRYLASPMEVPEDSEEESECIVGRFTPERLKERAGGKLKDAIVVAARSHAMVSPTELKEILQRSPLSRRRDYMADLDMIRRMTRVFDKEHPRSVPILNEFSQRLAHAVGVPPSLSHVLRRPGLVSECESREIDHIQAADMAAGWAVDLLTFTNGDYRTLAQRFAWVGVNGVVIPA